MFRIPQMDQWAVIVTSPHLIDEMRQFPEEKMSVAFGLGEVCDRAKCTGQFNPDNVL